MYNNNLETEKTDSIFRERIMNLHTDICEVKAAIKEVATAVTKLALIEERQTNHAESLERAFKYIEQLDHRITDNERRIIELEKSEPIQARTTEWVEKALWAFAAAAIAYIATHTGLVK